MDRIEEAAVLDCLRSIRGRIGLGSAQDAARKLIEIDRGMPRFEGVDIELGLAERYVHENHVHTKYRKRLSNAAIELISANINHIKNYYSKRKSHTYRYICAILFKNKGLKIGPYDAANVNINDQSSQDIVHTIFKDWVAGTRKGNGMLLTGLYQVFRRYKSPFRDVPVLAPSPALYDWSLPENQVMICELVYVDSNNMECIFVTSEYNIYFGTMHINHEDILFGVMRRKPDGSDGINYRFSAIKLETKKLPLYSGMTIKVGDTTRRPLASECLYIRLPRADHADLYKEFEDIIQNRMSVSRVNRGSIVGSYITENPPISPPYNPNNPGQAWSKVKFIREFPQFRSLITPDPSNVVLFREPSRTISVETIARMSGIDFHPFRH